MPKLIDVSSARDFLSVNFYLFIILNGALMVSIIAFPLSIHLSYANFKRNADNIA